MKRALLPSMQSRHIYVITLKALESIPQSTPDTANYLNKLQARKEFALFASTDRQANLTSTCRETTADIKEWLCIDPAYLRSSNVLMQTGLVRDTATCMLVEDTAGCKCEMCGQKLDNKRSWHGAYGCVRTIHVSQHKLSRRISHLTNFALSGRE